MQQEQSRQPSTATGRQARQLPPEPHCADPQLRQHHSTSQIQHWLKSQIRSPGISPPQALPHSLLQTTNSSLPAPLTSPSSTASPDPAWLTGHGAPAQLTGHHPAALPQAKPTPGAAAVVAVPWSSVLDCVPGFSQRNWGPDQHQPQPLQSHGGTLNRATNASRILNGKFSVVSVSRKENILKKKSCYVVLTSIQWKTGKQYRKLQNKNEKQNPVTLSRRH